LHPYRRHCRQTASLPPPHERARGQAGGATGDHARPKIIVTLALSQPSGYDRDGSDKFGFFIIQSITFHNYQQLSAKDGIKA
jgi:hypothetical protein